MRGFIIGLMLAGLVVVGQEKKPAFTPPKRDSISIPKDDLDQIRDAIQQKTVSDLSLDNTILRVKLKHSIPLDYLLNYQASKFDPPPQPDRPDAKGN